MRRSLRERLWAKVAIPDDFKRSCWIWRGAKSLKRYGERRPVIADGRRTRLAARVVCEWVHGPPPTDEHQAGHICPDGENRDCVSPFHLEWQTPQENRARRDSRRRAAVPTVTSTAA